MLKALWKSLIPVWPSRKEVLEDVDKVWRQRLLEEDRRNQARQSHFSYLTRFITFKGLALKRKLTQKETANDE